MSVSVHCEAKFWWVLGYIQGPFDYQRLFLSVWHGLSRHLLASWKVDICAYSYLFGCHLSLALPSVRFQDVFLMVFLMRRFAWNNHLILLLRRVREGIRLKKSLMNWSSHWELDLDDSPLLLGLLVFLIYHSMLWWQHQRKRLFLIMYVDDIIIIGDDAHGIAYLKC